MSACMGKGWVGAFIHIIYQYKTRTYLSTRRGLGWVGMSAAHRRGKCAAHRYLSRCSHIHTHCGARARLTLTLYPHTHAVHAVHVARLLIIIRIHGAHKHALLHTWQRTYRVFSLIHVCDLFFWFFCFWFFWFLVFFWASTNVHHI